MITSDRFANSLGSFRSRLFSPLFALPSDTTRFCLSFKHNMYSSSRNDGDVGFRVGIENFANHEETEILWTRTNNRADVDRWFSMAIPVDKFYQQNRVNI